MIEEPPINTGMFIRDYLLQNGRGFINEIWREFAKEKKKYRVEEASYMSFCRYFYILQEMGLIEMYRRAKRASGFAKSMYRIPEAEGLEDSPIWSHPIQVYNPLSILGKDRYRDLRAEANRREMNIVDLFYEKYGYVIRMVANELGSTESEVLKNMKEYGRSIRRVKLPKKPKAKVPKILRLRADGYSIEELAAEFNMTNDEIIHKLINTMRDQDFTGEEIQEEMETIASEMNMSVPQVKAITGPAPEEMVQVPEELPTEKYDEIVMLWETYDMEPEQISESLNIPYNQVIAVLVKELDAKGWAEDRIASNLEVNEETVRLMKRLSV